VRHSSSVRSSNQVVRSRLVSSCWVNRGAVIVSVSGVLEIRPPLEHRETEMPCAHQPLALRIAPRRDATTARVLAHAANGEAFGVRHSFGDRRLSQMLLAGSEALTPVTDRGRSSSGERRMLGRGRAVNGAGAVCCQQSDRVRAANIAIQQWADSGMTRR
jgi:hypothetical protein